MGEYFHSFDDEMKEMFGGKVYRLALSASHSCPNRDGRSGTGGCIFCSAGGSGDFAAEYGRDIDAQIEEAKQRVSRKLSRSFAGYMAYFQSFTETYGDEDYLAGCFEQAAAHSEVLALSVATRPDCISDYMLARLAGINRSKPVYVELGLQTVHDDTAEYINRCYHLDVFEDAFRRLKAAGLKAVVHVIIGLPGEDEERTIQTVKYLSELEYEGMHIDGIKLQLLHVLKGTRLAELIPREILNAAGNSGTSDPQAAIGCEQVKLQPALADNASGKAPGFGHDRAKSNSDFVENGEYIAGSGQIFLNDGKTLTCYNVSGYADLITRLAAMLPGDITIHRITGDAPKSLLIYPKWTADKKRVLNTITKTFIKTGRRQSAVFPNKE